MSEMTTHNPKNYYQAGATLAQSSPSYVKRKADDELYDNLLKGEFCYVLTARQMGKSSLKVQTQKRLKVKGWQCVDVDLTGIGSHGMSAEDWYYSLMAEIAGAVDCEDNFEDWYEEHTGLTPVAKLGRFWKEVLLKNTKEEVVIFIDEIDTLLSMDKQQFSTDDFFASIRATYNQRASNQELNRLHFCIIGVATPNDLMNDPERTPFNIGTNIRLEYFTKVEAEPLLSGLKHIDTNHNELLYAILKWTDGQPFLTQKLCKEIAENETIISNPTEKVNTYIKNIFLKPKTEETDSHLSNIQNRILNNKAYNSQMLLLYTELLNGKNININNTNETQLYLKLAGITKEKNGLLIIANKLYKEKFNKRWLEEVLAKVNRPFLQDMNRWLAFDKNSDALLKGEVLKKAEDWARKRNDLTQNEKEFIEESRNNEIRVEAENIRLKERERENKRLIALILMLIFALGVAAWQWYEAGIKADEALKNEQLANDKAKEALKNEQLANTANNNAQLALDSLEQKQNELEIEKQNAVDAGNFAEIKRIEAEQANIKTQQEIATQKKILKAFEVNALAIKIADENPTIAFNLTVWASQQLNDTNKIIREALYRSYRSGGVKYKSFKRWKGWQHSFAINSVCFSPDGKSVITGSYDKTAKLWDLNGKEL
ncbi:MAG: hypothetical protein CMO01_20275, partial [Thalassobius sp.]|nr:hypothetical protein [Thalassovita sp.]